MPKMKRSIVQGKLPSPVLCYKSVCKELDSLTILQDITLIQHVDINKLMSTRDQEVAVIPDDLVRGICAMEREVKSTKIQRLFVFFVKFPVVHRLDVYQYTPYKIKTTLLYLALTTSKKNVKCSISFIRY